MTADVDTFALVPPMSLAHNDELPIGTLVRWSHRAAVARWKAASYPRDEYAGDWLLTEGVGKGGWRPRMSPIPPGESATVLAFTQDLDPFYERPPRDGVNKTVFVWPDVGAGFLFGLVRRGIGRSEPARAASGGWLGGSEVPDEGDPGGFAAEAFVPLYAIKCELQGVSYLLAPTWAVTAA